VTRDLQFCRCGCGKRVKNKNYSYLLGHYWKGRKRGPHSQETKDKISRGVNLAYKDKKVREKHFKNTPRGEKHSCYGTPGNWLGRNHSSKTKERMRAIQLGSKHHFYGKKHKESTKQKISKSCKNWWYNTEEGRIQKEKQKCKMKNGGSSYCNSFIINPSSPQIELFEKVKIILNDAILNYPFFNYSLDIAIPGERICIEYDGSYWHSNKEYDKRRREYLKRHKWRCLYYVDYVPSIDILRKDVEELRGVDIGN
jgi:hypothetical protein